MDNPRLIISFPHMGGYYQPISRMLRTLFPGQEIRPAPPITKHTLELGNRYSPDAVCAPFKYTLGNYIEALDNGANVLLQTGMGCRYGYYGPVQEQILRDLGYTFTFLCFSRDRATLRTVYRTIRKLGSPCGYTGLLHAALMAAQRIRLMDRFEHDMRLYSAFERRPGSYAWLKPRVFDRLDQANSLGALMKVHRDCRPSHGRVALRLPEQPLRVGIVGELYTLMEPFSNAYVENQLLARGISVSRAMSVSFLLFGKHDRRSLRSCGGYLHHTLGANGVDSVAQCKQYAQLGYDGVIHMKSFGCAPELNAMPALFNISRDYHLPMLHLSFDAHTSDTGVQTRIEAFCDMIQMRRQTDDASGFIGRGHRVHLDQGCDH